MSVVSVLPSPSLAVCLSLSLLLSLSVYWQNVAQLSMANGAAVALPWGSSTGLRQRRRLHHPVALQLQLAELQESAEQRVALEQCQPGGRWP